MPSEQANDLPVSSTRCDDHFIFSVSQIKACEKIIARFVFHHTYLLIDTILRQRSSSPSIPAQYAWWAGCTAVRAAAHPICRTVEEDLYSLGHDTKCATLDQHIPGSYARNIPAQHCAGQAGRASSPCKHLSTALACSARRMTSPHRLSHSMRPLAPLLMAPNRESFYERLGRRRGKPPHACDEPHGYRYITCHFSPFPSPLRQTILGI